jgi:cystathionine beta-synthase
MNKTEARSGKILDSIADAIGNTPLVKLSKIAPQSRQNILAKCEFLNPGGSVKDRIAKYMIEKAEEEGRLKPGQLIVEATGGNTGIGLAMMARLKGYKLLCVCAEKVGKEKINMQRLYGAEVLVVPGGKAIEDPAHFINQAKRISEERGAWYVNQFNNPDNAEAHYNTTGPEIWEQTEGKVDVLVAGIGTGGTICGAGKYLKERKSSVKLVLADPQGSNLGAWLRGEEPQPASYLVEGIGNDFVPGIVDLKKIDHAVYVNDQESIKMAHDLIDKEALHVSGSAGCVVAAALKYGEQEKESGLNIVAVLPGTGRYYLSTIFNDEWLAQKLPGIQS